MEHAATELTQFLQHGNHLLEQLLSDAAQHWQISPAEVRILLFLFNAPHLDTARDVAIHCGMSKASVSGNVLKLATRGLLTVDVDLADRRFQHLTLTEQSTPILKTIQEKVLHFSQKLLSPLSHEEQSQLLNLLTRLNVRTDEH